MRYVKMNNAKKSKYIKALIQDHVYKNNGKLHKPGECLCNELNFIFYPGGDLECRKFVDNRKGSYTEGETLKITMQDSYGIYYKREGKVWCVYWYELDDLFFL